MLKEKKTGILLDLIQKGKPMTLKQQLSLTVQLSVPAIIAQLSFIIMQYIDAAMVGSLGAESSASIGLVSTTTWLFWGLCVAAATLVPFYKYLGGTSHIGCLACPDFRSERCLACHVH